MEFQILWELNKWLILFAQKVWPCFQSTIRYRSILKLQSKITIVNPQQTQVDRIQSTVGLRSICSVGGEQNWLVVTTAQNSANFSAFTSAAKTSL